MGRKVNHNHYLVAQVDIRGIDYKIYLYPQDVYDKLYPGSMANVDTIDMQFRFSEKNRDLMTVRHEVAHAFIASCFYSAIEDGTADGLEEVVCEVISYFAEKMIQISNEIKKQLDIAKGDRDVLIKESRKKSTSKSSRRKR